MFSWYRLFSINQLQINSRFNTWDETETLNHLQSWVTSQYFSTSCNDSVDDRFMSRSRKPFMSCDPWGAAGQQQLQSTAVVWLHVSLLLPCVVSETLTASCPLKELTPIMPWEAVLAREGIWLWLRGTLYRASAMSAALFRMISWEAQGRQRFFCYLWSFHSSAFSLMHGSRLHG